MPRGRIADKSMTVQVKASGIKLLPEPKLIQFYTAIWGH